MTIREILERCNHTELYGLCKEHGLQVDPASSREQLVSYFLQEADIPAGGYNEVDAWRHGIMGFLLDHWEVVQSQLECPAKSGDPRACFVCTDAMVLSCVTDNAQNEKLIQLKRRREP